MLVFDQALCGYEIKQITLELQVRDQGKATQKR